MHISNCSGLSSGNNPRLLNSEVPVLDRASPASVVIWQQGSREQMVLTDCNFPTRDGRSVHAGKDHGHKGEKGRLISTRSIVPHGTFIIQIKL